MKLLSQLPDSALIRLLRPAGAVVVQPNGQFLKGYTLLIGLADPQIAAHQVQLSGLEHILHALEEQRPGA